MRSVIGRPAGASAMLVRRARLEDVNAMLGVIQRAVEWGCRRHYSPLQRRAVFLSYARQWFVEVVQPLHTVAGLVDGRIVAAAQVDVPAGRLRALFVDGDQQGLGRGRDLLEWAERQVRAAGGQRLQGAMSLNAVPFYARAGFQPGPGNRWLSHDGVAVPVLPMQKRL